MGDPVKAPAHYAGDGKVEAKDALASMMSAAHVGGAAAYWWGCAMKYVWRWPNKGGVQDIDKAIQCLSELRALAARNGRRTESERAERRALGLACETVYGLSGECPYSMSDREPRDCASDCGPDIDAAGCWAMHFVRMAKGETE